MAITVNDYQDLVRLIRQRPEWQVELRHLLLDDDFLALPRIVSELAEAQRRTEARVEQLAEAQRRTEARLEELVEIVKRHEEHLFALRERTDEILERLGRLDGWALERRYIERAHSFFGRWLRRVRVILPGGLDAETERRLVEQLTEEEFQDVLRLDLLARGIIHQPATLAGQEVWLAVEISLTVDREDVRRARERAALLRKAGLFSVPVVAGDGVTQGASDTIQSLHVVLLLNGHAQGWEEAVLASQEGNN